MIAANNANKQQIDLLNEAAKKIINIIRGYNFDKAKQNILFQIQQVIGSYQELLSNQIQESRKIWNFFNKNGLVNKTNILITEEFSKNKIKNILVSFQDSLISYSKQILDKLNEFQEIINFINLDDIHQLTKDLQNYLKNCFVNNLNELDDQQIVQQIWFINRSISFELNIKQILNNKNSEQIQRNINQALGNIKTQIDKQINDISQYVMNYKQKVKKYFKLKQDYLQSQNQIIQQSQMQIQQPYYFQNQLSQQIVFPQTNKEDIQVKDEFIQLNQLQMNIIQKNQDEFRSLESCIQSRRSSISSCMNIKSNDQFRQKSHSVVWNDNIFNSSQIIIWIDKNIKSDDNQKYIFKLRQKFPWVEVKGFENFNEFQNYLNDKFQQQYEMNNKINQNLKIKRFNTELNLNLLDGHSTQEDLTKSFISQCTVYQKLEQQTEKELNLQFIFIASGSLIKEEYDRISCFLKSIIIYCNCISEYLKLFENKKNISIISKDFNQIILKIEETLQQKKKERIYNYDIKKLKEFEEFDLIRYMSKDYCAQEIVIKTKTEFQNILENIYKCLGKKNEKIDALSEKFSEFFINVDKIIEFYTTNQFCNFIQELMSYLNEQILQSASYLITTLRYSIQVYNDSCKEIFNQENFTLYRGINIDTEKFQKDFPKGTTFVTFNFSSSSLKRDIALQFAILGQKNPMIFEITFDINNEDFEKCRPKKIKRSKYQEGEFIFNCFSIFHVKNYRKQDQVTYAELSFINNVFED
ncbi:hypothetical protein TTHERM_00059070 (macronuclear) [Tetrahymena thermophila SB210]|uniref:Uncharacterized protein n=1 Tax=Tetrahymena thermophila (strain SB210) TaxID=312017 RepID=I7MDD8_TETTS|nr:hypothetical protein TTHERM_00059070 [Tetrahymena thermophila SB210]EAR87394.2 hypothetical protein TTHERM_00059070 [Tetrahymena thermophila SB210]|eukprot:XP_001007639.2 hypothetical protein TTHERM_00059070 [Tetrahymena thermophila SB210]